MLGDSETRNGVMLANIVDIIELLDDWIAWGEIVDAELLKRKMGILIGIIGIAGYIRTYNDERSNWITFVNSLGGMHEVIDNDIKTMLNLQELLMKFRWSVAAKHN
jgi:hypothetical protein